MRFVVSILAAMMVAGSAAAGDIGRHDNSDAKRRGIREAREQLQATRDIAYELRRVSENEAIDRASEKRLEALLRRADEVLHPNR